MTGQAEGRSGSLASTPFALVLQTLAAQGLTAVIELRHGPVEKRVVLEEGIPVDCRSNLATDTFGRFLIAAGKIRDEEFHSALAEAARQGVPLGQVLVQREVITSFELFRLLQQNLARKLLDLFSWRDGEFSVSWEVPHVESPLKVRPWQLILTGVMKFARQSDIDAAIVPLIGRRVALNPTPPFPLQELRFTKAQRAVAKMLEKPTRIDELATGELSYEEIARFLHAMTIVGAVVPEEKIPRGVSPGRLPAEEQIAPQTMSGTIPIPAVSQPVDEGLRNDLMKAYLSHRHGDAFDFFSLPEEAGPEEIRRSYLAFAERFAPWKLTSDELAPLREKAEELFIAAARAHSELSHGEQRATLLHRRRAAREQQRLNASADRFKLRTDLLDPDVQFRKGVALRESGQLREALAQFEFATDCDAQNALYRSEAAYTRYLVTPSASTASASLESLREAMRVDSECGIAFFYAGEIHRQLGNAGEAEPLLRKACKLMAPDRRPVEALKALLTR
jgi:hypothetical protein